MKKVPSSKRARGVKRVKEVQRANKEKMLERGAREVKETQERYKQ
jgi:hypothetical protein